MASFSNTVEDWVMEYACTHCLMNVINEIKTKSQRWPELKQKYSLRLLLTTIVSIVEHRTEQQYECAIELLDYVLNIAELLSVRQHRRISCCFKIFVMLNKVKARTEDVVVKLNEHFPKSAEREENEAARHVKAFRKLVLRLHAQRESRWRYFQTTFVQDYGEEFQQSFERMARRTIQKCFNKLPSPVIDMLITSGKDSPIHRELCACSLPVVQYIVDIVTSVPKQEDLLELLNMVYPSQDDPHVNPLAFSQTQSPQNIFADYEEDSPDHQNGHRSTHDVSIQNTLDMHEEESIVDNSIDEESGVSIQLPQLRRFHRRSIKRKTSS